MDLDRKILKAARSSTLLGHMRAHGICRFQSSKLRTLQPTSAKWG
jgi:hypothetical protein